MSFLKRIPIKYTGELHDVRLINFSVLPEDISDLVPKGITPRLFNGRAVISMVDVKLKNMRTGFIPGFFSFHYSHLAFRLLIDDSAWSGKEGSSGIFFLRSFTNSQLVAMGGSLLTNYNLKPARVAENAGTTSLRQGGHTLTYSIDNRYAQLRPTWLKEQVGSLDKAYSIYGSEVQYIQVQREKWPIEWVNCNHFETDFFPSARLEGAFRVNETIYYTWLPPQNVNQ